MHPPGSTPTLPRRTLLRGAAAAAVVGAAALATREVAATADGVPTRLRLLAHGSLPSGTMFKDTLVGGLSGLAYDGANNLWYALSDDRSRHAPARCYVLRLPLSLLGIQPAAGSRFGFGFVIFDDDAGHGHDFWMQTTSGIAGGWAPETLPRFYLAP